jgi:ubiquinone/menaquinone biosynthesis C-methylase UbiE
MIKDPYHRLALIYDRLFERLGRNGRLIVFRMFQATKEMRILDVGCGTGMLLNFYRRSHCLLYGVDASASMLSAARKKFGDAADLCLADASHLPYESGSFDIVLCMLVLHEWTKQQGRQ